MLDRFSQSVPWEEEKLLSQQDWQGNRLVVGFTYYDIDGDYVHEDEVMDYINDNYRKVEAEEDSQL